MEFSDKIAISYVQSPEKKSPQAGNNSENNDFLQLKKFSQQIKNDCSALNHSWKIRETSEDSKTCYRERKLSSMKFHTKVGIAQFIVKGLTCQPIWLLGSIRKVHTVFSLLFWYFIGEIYKNSDYVYSSTHKMLYRIFYFY